MQLASNNEMHLLSELEAMGNLLNRTRQEELIKKNESEHKLEQVQAPKDTAASDRRSKSWTSIKAEARAVLQAGKEPSENQAKKPKSQPESKEHLGRPVDAVNLQSESSHEVSEEEFEG